PVRRWSFLRNGIRYGRRHILHRVNLDAANIWMNSDTMSTRPLVRIIMLVNPKQTVHVAAIRLQHNATHVVIDAHRAHMRIGSITNTFIVDAAGHRVLPEFGDKTQDRLLLG